MPAATVLNAAGLLSVGSAIEQLTLALQAVPGGATSVCVAAPAGAPEPAAQFNQLIGNWTNELMSIAGHAQGLGKAVTSAGQHLAANDDRAAADTPE